MFDIGWTELVVIAVVAILVIGPKDLPRAMRTVGKYSGKMKRMARDFQNQFNEALREAELDEVKKEVQSIAKIDPMADLKKDLAKTEAGIKSDLAKPANGADTEMKALTADTGTVEPEPAVEAKIEPEVDVPARTPAVAAEPVAEKTS
jgi:sec-independent protein translocase protein TatB